MEEGGERESVEALMTNINNIITRTDKRCKFTRGGPSSFNKFVSLERAGRSITKSEEPPAVDSHAGGRRRERIARESFVRI